MDSVILPTLNEYLKIFETSETVFILLIIHTVLTQATCLFV